jgi:membrane protease YdiL (CAAX protease family)
MTAEIRLALLRVLPFLVVLIAFRIAVKRKRLNTNDLGIQPPLSYWQLFIWWGLFLVFMVATELTLYKTGLLEVTHWHHDLPSSIIRILGIVILAPVSEELLFRGLFIHKLTQWKLNKHWAILIQALVFVLLHSFTYENTLSSNIGIIQSFLDACIFGYARFNTQSIYTSIAMHATGNLIAVLEQFII